MHFPSIALALALSTSVLALAATPNTPAATTYSCAATTKAALPLTAASVFSPTAAGFDLDSAPTVSGSGKKQACTSDRPFFFSASLPEGSYRVTVVLGGPQASITTVRAEARRLMLEKIPTAPNASVTRTFDINLRVPGFGPGKQVRLKPREIGNLDWDAKLTLEFNGDHPSVRSIAIQPVHERTVFLAGDSTVVDQDVEPWAAWGQMLPCFFRPGIVIANHAESGETLRSFIAEQRFAKIFSLLQPGDYLFFQFNHNDQKIDRNTGQPVVPIEDYKRLLTEYTNLTRKIGATPVLVTSMNRRTFDPAGHITNSLAGYPDAMREVASTEHVALIDLNAMSKTLFEALGPQASMHAFMHYAANTFPNQTESISDDTHFNSYGAYELARCIVQGIRAANLPLTKFLDPAIPTFDPAHPDPQSTFSLPFTPIRIAGSTTKVPQT